MRTSSLGFASDAPAGDAWSGWQNAWTYAQGQPFPWAENLRSAIRKTRRGLDHLDRPPSHPVGLAIYADWTTTPDEWALYQSAWVEG